MKKTNIFKYSFPIGIVGIIISVILFATNWFYELVVPVIENSSLEGAAFTFFDDLIFYCPLIFLGLFIAYLIAGQIINKRLNEEAIDKSNKESQEKNQAIIDELNDKRDWLKRNFYSNCPNCGSAREEHQSHCIYCGANLEIKKKIKN